MWNELDFTIEEGVPLNSEYRCKADFRLNSDRMRGHTRQTVSGGRFRPGVTGRTIVRVNDLHESTDSHHQHEKHRRPGLDAGAHGLATRFHNLLRREGKLPGREKVAVNPTNEGTIDQFPVRRQMLSSRRVARSTALELGSTVSRLNSRGKAESAGFRCFVRSQTGMSGLPYQG